MKRGPNEAICTAYGRAAAFGKQEELVPVGGPGWISTDGPIGPIPISAAAADLLDIALVVYRAERQLRRRAPSNPNVRFELTIPLRDPVAWKGRPTELLQELLGFLGNAVWEITLVKRPARAAGLNKVKRSGDAVTRITLFSGGLDSACGAGSGLIGLEGTHLCSFSTRQGPVLRQIAASLKFGFPTQWHQAGKAGPGRSFYYRSFLFLSLAAVTAQSWGAREVIQCENGILASAIPPVPPLAMTRHAHPRLHQMFRELLDRILPGSWRIANPLWTMTKRQAVRLLEKEIGKKRATEITSVTQSCWNLWAPQVFGVRKFDRSEKKPNEHCGVCIPCIVRRTALPEDHFAFDLRHDSVRNHPKLGAHFLEYLELVSAVRASRTTADLRTVIPAEGLELIDDGYIDLGSLENLLREFSKEFHETFF